MSLIAELKRRNVFRVAVAYAVIAWVLAQVADLAFDNFGAPDWVPKSVLFVLLLGFPLAVFFAWAFEMTPEGVKKEKDVDRSQSITSQTGRKLDFLIIGVLVIAVGLLLVDKFVLREPVLPETAANAVIGTDKSVAVLPFVAMSNGPDDEYFADGLTEEILNSLAQLPELLVTARTSAFSFKGMDLPIPEVAAKLGVAHVVEGSVRRAGERLRITAQLIRANDGFHLWSETYDRSGADSFGVQGEIAEKVAAALDIVLDAQQLAKMRSSGFRKPEAFIAYQKGIELYDGAHGTASVEEQMTKLMAANQYFERVMELEPGFSGAHYHHADYYIHLVTNGSEDGSISDAAVTEALSVASRELQLAARTARTEGERLNVTLEDAMVSSQWRRLPELVADAIRSPDCISPGWWGGSLVEFSASDGLLALWQRSQECDPLNFYNWSNVAAAQTSRGEYRAAVATATRGMEIVPHRQIASELIAARMALGEFDQALAASQRYFDDVDRRDAVRLLLAAARGDAAEAQRLVDERVAKLGADRITIAMLAIIGDRENANRRAAIQDGRALGYLNLINDLGACNCGAPFDLEVTPNFARFIEESGLAWPPPSPIEWPLKDW